MKMKLVRIWSAVSTVLVIIIVLFAVFLMGSRLIGFRVFTVISGSMSPTFNVGDLIYVRSVDPSEIKEGDPITFVVNENLVVVTHRVVSIDAANKCFYTKGDANNTPDSSPVNFKNVIGVPQFSIPLLGYVSDFIQNPPGLYITIGLCAALLFVVSLPDFIRWRRRKNVSVPASYADGGEESEDAQTGERIVIAEKKQDGRSQDTPALNSETAADSSDAETDKPHDRQ